MKIEYFLSRMIDSHATMHVHCLHTSASSERCANTQKHTQHDWHAHNFRATSHETHAIETQPLAVSMTPTATKAHTHAHACTHMHTHKSGKRSGLPPRPAGPFYSSPMHRPTTPTAGAGGQRASKSRQITRGQRQTPASMQQFSCTHNTRHRFTCAIDSPSSHEHTTPQLSAAQHSALSHAQHGETRSKLSSTRDVMHEHHCHDTEHHSMVTHTQQDRLKHFKATRCTTCPSCHTHPIWPGLAYILLPSGHTAV